MSALGPEGRRAALVAPSARLTAKGLGEAGSKVSRQHGAASKNPRRYAGISSACHCSARLVSERAAATVGLPGHPPSWIFTGWMKTATSFWIDRRSLR